MKIEIKTEKSEPCKHPKEYEYTFKQDMIVYKACTHCGEIWSLQLDSWEVLKIKWQRSKPEEFEKLLLKHSDLVNKMAYGSGLNDNDRDEMEAIENEIDLLAEKIEEAHNG